MRTLTPAFIFPLLLPFAFVWQLSPLAQVPFFAWRLDPTLVLVVAAGFLLGPRYGLTFGLLAGAGQDLLVGAGLLYAAAKALAGFSAGLLHDHIYRLDALSLAVFGFAWTLGESLIVALLLLLQGKDGIWSLYAAMGFPIGLAHAVLLPIVYLTLHPLLPEKEGMP